jgi:coenzyme A diphosphatase NUDT7
MLTSSLINTARVAYGREPEYDHFAPHQPPFTTAISNIVIELPEVLERDRLSLLAGEVKEVRPLEWGGVDPNVRWRSGEVYETT